jgi:hypothetical protein
MLISGAVEDWEAWTSMAFPKTAEYTFPEGLATLHIDRENNRATYLEPNVWMIHPDGQRLTSRVGVQIISGGL